MSKKLKPIPEFRSEAEERKFWETHDFDRICGLVEGPVGSLSQPEALDDVNLLAAADWPSRSHQDRGQSA